MQETIAGGTFKNNGLYSQRKATSRKGEDTWWTAGNVHLSGILLFLVSISSEIVKEIPYSTIFNKILAV